MAGNTTWFIANRQLVAPFNSEAILGTRSPSNESTVPDNFDEPLLEEVLQEFYERRSFWIHIVGYGCILSPTS